MCQCGRKRKNEIKVNDLNDLIDKINDLSMSDTLDAETSLQLAAEAGNLLLKENYLLKQELHKLKAINTELQLTLEDRVKEFDEEIHTLTERGKIKEEELQQIIKALEDKVTNNNEFKDDLICTMEQEMSEYVFQVKTLKNVNRSLSEEIILLGNKVEETEINMTILKGQLDSFTNPGHMLATPNHIRQCKTKTVGTQTDKLNLHMRNINRENIQELLGTRWINDDIIRIYYDLINDKLLGNAIVKCLSPTVCQAVKLLEDTDCLLKPMELKNFQYILIPVNDSAGTDCGAGSHWSLLICRTGNQSFYYYDSLKKYNLPHAQKIANKFFNHLSPPNQNQEAVITLCNTPQQLNSYDCGIYVLALTDIIIDHLKSNPSTSLEKIYLPELNKSDLISKRALTAYILNNRTVIKKEDLVSLLVPKRFIDTTTRNKEDEVKESLVMSHNTSVKSKDAQVGVWKTVRSKNWKSSHKVKNIKKTIDKPQLYSPLRISNNFEILNSVEQETKCGKTDHSLNHKKNTNIGKKKRSDTSTSLKTKSDKQIKVTVFSDSQGREIGQLIDANVQSQDKIKTEAVLMPNATLLQVIQSAINSTRMEDVAVIVGGTNDTLKGNIDTIFKDFEGKLNELTSKKIAILSTIPTRFDMNAADPIHDDICLTNNYIRELVARSSNVHLIDLDLLSRFHYTRHGLHLNHRGRGKIAHMIVNTLNRSQEKRKWEVNENFTINETNMRILIDKYKADETVAFAHSISADFDCPRHMTAGVAVIFREEIGRPSTSNYIASHLTFQRSPGRAAVYSLVTKPQYFTKPYPEDYDLAFKQLTDDFKKRGLKHLVCSPIGAVRDRVRTEHFAANICEFQRITGASVEIVSYFQKSRRELRNGMTHDDFIKQITNDISIRLQPRVCSTLPMAEERLASNTATNTATNTTVTTNHTTADTITAATVYQLPPPPTLTMHCAASQEGNKNTSRSFFQSPSFASMSDFPPLHSTQQTPNSRWRTETTSVEGRVPDSVVSDPNVNEVVCDFLLVAPTVVNQV